MKACADRWSEVDRANDNLAKSTRMFGMPAMPGPAPFARQYPEFGALPLLQSIGRWLLMLPTDPRIGPSSRHHSISGEFDGMRSHSSHSSSSVQGYLAHQRFPSRINEQEHMAKRRAAAQRERELRNYHQEQQYSRSKPDRPIPFI